MHQWGISGGSRNWSPVQRLGAAPPFLGLHTDQWRMKCLPMTLVVLFIVPQIYDVVLKYLKIFVTKISSLNFRF
jgi:hypothetical protein